VAGRALIRDDIARCARILHRLGLVNAFGHVSARDDDRVWITPTLPPLADVTGRNVLDASVPVSSRPLEAPMHLAVYAERPDVGAICRIHGEWTSAMAAKREVPMLLHGFGGIVEPLGLWPDPDLIADSEAAHNVVKVLGPDGAGVILAGNGAFVVGADLPEAMARAWCLEDRCRVALRLIGASVQPFRRKKELEPRGRWYAAETARLWAWLDATHADI
jgi:HCOMODA/2-hydroxy-3-carboxy-muconic semialdehyde decarboxylase